jgi:transposase
VETMIARCCGLDVHNAQLTACVRLLIDGVVTQIVETFGTTTPDLLALRDWLKAHAVTDVAMESTGVYWKPVYYMLEDESRCGSSTRRTSNTSPGADRHDRRCVDRAAALLRAFAR